MNLNLNQISIRLNNSWQNIIRKFPKAIFLFVGVWNISFNVFAQQEVHVNTLKGLMTVDIPAYTFNLPSFKVELGFSYTGSGMKLNDAGSPTGWQFNGGGVVRRIVRGQPDEGLLNGAWGGRLYNASNAAYAANFIVNDDNDENNCDDEGLNASSLASIPAQQDLEPDIFMVSAPGLNFRMVVDNEGVFKTIPAQDIQIQVFVNWYDRMDFVITKGGIKYTFSSLDLDYVTRKPKNVLHDYDLFRTYPNLFTEINGNNELSVTNIDNWYLTKIELLNAGQNSTLSYSYEKEERSNVEEFKVMIKDNAADTAREQKLYDIFRTGNKKILKSIASSLGDSVSISWLDNFPKEILIYHGREPGRLADQRIDLYRNKNTVTKLQNNFLTQIVKSSASLTCQRESYVFDYYGFSTMLTSIPTLVHVDFPAFANKKSVDAWGYLNGNTGTSDAPKIHVYPALHGSTGVYRPYEIPGYTGEHYVLPGNDKTPNDSMIRFGAMSKITYPNLGSSSFEYEQNSFFDHDANAEVKGGGLRIKAINHFDGMNTNNVMRKEYIYQNNLGVTSGTINLLPAYAISTNAYRDPISNIDRSYNDILTTYGSSSLDYWNYLTVRTEQDCYNGESTVSYSQVTTKETGNGQIKEVFSPVKSFWDISSSVLSYPAEACLAGNSTFIRKGYNQYPFARVEYSYGGDLIEEYVYNETGNLLKKRELEYENYYTTPLRVYGILSDSNFGLRQFSKYYVEVTGTLLKKNIETIYDSNLIGNSIVKQIDYDNSAVSRQVRSELVTNSDGSQVRTSYMYPGDLSFNALDEDLTLLGMMEMVYALNMSPIIEQRVEVKPAGSSTFKTISASANVYRLNNINSNYRFPVLKEILSFKNNDGVTDFAAAQITGPTLSRTFSTDSRYQKDAIFEHFSNSNLAGSITQKRVLMANVSDSLMRLPLLKVEGASLEDIAFCNFDRMDSQTFTTVSGTEEKVDPYYGKGLRASLTKAFNRKPEDKFYKLAFLAKTGYLNQHVNVYVNNTLVHQINIPITSDYRFRFYEQLIDLSSVSSGTLRVEMDSGVMDPILNIPEHHGVMDNVIFLPADAQFVMNDYHPLKGKTMEMNSLGEIALFEYRDGQLIAERNINGDLTRAYYKSTAIKGNLGTIRADVLIDEFTYFSYLGRAVELTAYDNCLPGIKYIWNFGDGVVVETYEPRVSHEYSHDGVYSVTVTLQNPEVMSVTSEAKTVTIYTSPNIVVSVNAIGISAINTLNPFIKYYFNPYLDPVISPNGTILSATGYVSTFCDSPSYQWEVSWDGINYSDVYVSSYDEYGVSTNPSLMIAESKLLMDVYFRCKISSPSCNLETYTDPIFIQANWNVY